ncbi:MAG: RNA polymerase subunit sigma-54 [Flavobacteriaceae bacterium]|nr:RNA polymerase subunit sigma-54 [Flavobacteriaceae bacterium]
MKVNIQSPQRNVSAKLNDFIKKKLNKLELFYDRILRAEVFLKLANSSEKSNKIAEILLHVPGEQLIIKKRSSQLSTIYPNPILMRQDLLVEKMMLMILKN